MNPDSKRLVVVSNRLPISLSRNSDGTFDVRAGSGGLVTALSPVLRNRGGLWIGWLGAPDVDDTKSILDKGSAESGYTLVPVELTQEEVGKYYSGFSNEILWFLFHGLSTLCNFDPEYWPAYQSVNRKFAQVIAERTEPTDFIWIHDYHLLLCAHELRSMGVKQHLGFFLHIPFPSFDTFIRLPWRRELLHGLLQYDLLGFQTLRDMRNFVRCVRTFVPSAKTLGTGSVMTLRALDREIRIGAFPIGIDFRLFATRSASDEVHRESLNLQNNLNVPRLILGLDRLDYTKGIPYRIRAFADTLETYPELRGNVTFLQVVVPSRLDVGRYQVLKDEIERAIGDINGRFTQPGWTPIQYIFRSLTDIELLAYYRIANVALITPLKDGMNLVAKEYCACKPNEDGVLVLSEFAGAAAQFRHDALLVNPYDVKGTAAIIHRALTMDGQERRERMRRLRRITQRSNVFHWVDSFLKVAIAKTIKDFPPVTDFAPVLMIESESA
ncbi:trehalose-6-phosphate synthase [bacterium]|nr:trehalose-6-phosphate synthase [bacterium]MBU1984339.1 trehalose-6-phosphate synthase [bacterium]